MKHDKYYKSLRTQSLAAATLSGEDANQLQPYFDNLDEALSDNSVKNIALYGKYGAGKTTLINSYLEYRNSSTQKASRNSSNKDDSQAHPPKQLEGIKPLRLSMATFTRTVNRLSEIKEPASDVWVEVERSLVQQMLYKPTNSKLPNSQYKRTEPVNIGLRVLMGFVAFLFFVSALVLLTWDDLITWMPIIDSYHLLAGICLLTTGGILFGFAMYNFPHFFGSAKLGWGQSELTIKDERSFFDEYLNEIIYFFAKTRYNLVILEDIDRFDDLSIFEHLRELNQLLNGSEVIQKSYGLSRSEKPSIRFLYALKQDLFNADSVAKRSDKSETKLEGNQEANADVACESDIAEVTTKFFDWTITMLPRVTADNASDFLIQRFDEPSEPFKDFLRSVGVFFDDIRVLENALNDLSLFVNLQTGDDLDARKMLALLLFKNAYPVQYQLFLNHDGALDKMLRTRRLAHIIVKDDQERLDQLQRRRKEIENDTRNWVLNLYRLKFFSWGASKSDRLETYYGNSKKLDIDRMTIENLRDFYNYVENESAKFYWGNSYSNSHEPKELVIRTTKFDSEKYFSDPEVQSEIEKLGIDPVKIEIAELSDKINSIHKQPLHVLAASHSRFVVEQLEDTGEAAQLYLSYCVTNGYLDETVDDYVAFFTGKGISNHDRRLVRRLRGGDTIELNEPIDDVAAFCADLNESDLQKTSILLSELIGFASENKNQLTHKVEKAYKAALTILQEEDPARFSYHVDSLMVSMPIEPARINFIQDLTSRFQKSEEKHKIRNWEAYSGEQDDLLCSTIVKMDVNEVDIPNVIEATPLFADFINQVHFTHENMKDYWHVTYDFLSDYSEQANDIYTSDVVQLETLDSLLQADVGLIDYLIAKDAVQLNENTLPTMLKAYSPTKDDSLGPSAILNSNDVLPLKTFLEKNLAELVKVEAIKGYGTTESKTSISQLISHSNLDMEAVRTVLKDYGYSDLKFDAIHLESPNDTINAILETDTFDKTIDNLNYLWQLPHNKWLSDAINTFIERTNYLSDIRINGNMNTSETRCITNILNEHVLLRWTNAEVVLQSGPYFAANQNTEVIRQLISHKLVVLSEQLISAISDQGMLVKLCYDQLLNIAGGFDELQQKLFDSLTPQSLFHIVHEKSQTQGMLPRMSLKAIVDHYLEGDSITEDQKIELLKVAKNWNFSEKLMEIPPLLTSIKDSGKRIEGLNSSIRDSNLDLKEVTVLITKSKIEALKPIVSIAGGVTATIGIDSGVEEVLDELKNRKMISIVRRSKDQRTVTVRKLKRLSDILKSK